MVSTVDRDGMTWYECDRCGLLFDNESDAEQHEEVCAGDESPYIE